MKLIIALAKSCRWMGASALAASVANGVAISFTLAMLNRALNATTDAADLGLQFLGLITVMMVLRWAALSQFVRLSQTVLARLRMHVSRQVAGLPFESVEARGEARLLAVLTEDVSTVGEGFGLLPWLFVHTAVILGCLGYLAWLSSSAFGCLLLLIGIGAIGYAPRAHAAHVELRAARMGEDALFVHFQALLKGAKELRLHAARRSAFIDGALAPSIDSVRQARTRGLSSHSLLSNWRLALFFAAIGGALFLAAPALGVSEQVRSGYALILLYMMLPVNALLEATPSLSRMSVALERIEELGVSSELEVGPAQSVSGALLQPGETFRELTLRAISRRYRVDGQPHEFVLGPLDMTLKAGEVVFLIGGNGSGKTTLAKLLVGLYAPNEGKILCNDQEVPSASRDAYRALFAAVFTDFHLFGRLLGETYPDLDARAQALLNALDLASKVKIRNGVMSTTELSSGQRKRLALLTAVLEDRPVYVFDEWAADQDPAYKEVFYSRVLPELKRRGKAVLVITHDDRYFHLADRCLKLEQGAFVRSPVIAEAPRRAAATPWIPASA